jgi:hypothetical protein
MSHAGKTGDEKAFQLWRGGRTNEQWLWLVLAGAGWPPAGEEHLLYCGRLTVLCSTPHLT